MLTQGDKGTDTLYFTYDAGGTPTAVTYNGTTYYYVTNLQGDIVAILDSTGTSVVNYTYDAWGNPLSRTGTMKDTLGILNPLRYRGYVYDQETRLYYLQSRYYNPEIGRFISADAFVSTGQGFVGNNMFAYCNNNPVMLSDPNGHAPEWWQWAISGAMVVAGVALVATGVGGVAGGALICAGANSIIGSYVSEATGGSSVAGWAGGMVTGAIGGLGAGAAGGMLISATSMTGAACLGSIAASGAVAYGSGAIGSAAGTIITSKIDGRQPTKKEIAQSATVGGSVNMVAGIASGMGAAIGSMPIISETSKLMANFAATGWSLLSETVVDVVNIVVSWIC